MDNKFGTPNPIPFRVVDSKIGLDIDVSVRCSGVYSYKIENPLLFYTNVCGNVEREYTREELDAQLKTEFISALAPAFGELSKLELRPNQIATHSNAVEEAMNKTLSRKWGELRGLRVVSVALNPVTLPEEDANLIKNAQHAAILRDPTMAAATLVGAQAEAMKSAAANENGAVAGFMGYGMAANAGGINAQNLYAMGQTQQAPAAKDGWICPGCGKTADGNFCQHCGAKKLPRENEWTCACGQKVTGKFCPECGAKKPEDGWTCPGCGKVNKGKFCGECGTKKPAGTPLYRCDKCGWQPEDPKNPPRFCPECGDPFNEEDIK